LVIDASHWEGDENGAGRAIEVGQRQFRSRGFACGRVSIITIPKVVECDASGEGGEMDEGWREINFAISC